MRGRVLMVVLAIVAAAIWALAQIDAGDDAKAVRDFKHIRILIFAIDQQSGDTAGFVDTQLAAGESTAVEPYAGHRIRLSAGQIKQETITDFVREWKESAIPFTVSYDRASSEGSQYLTEPDIHVEYDPKAAARSVIISVPVGSLRSPEFAKLLEAKPRGEVGELEDMLMAMAKDDQLRPQRLVDVYAVVKKSQRLPQWVAMSKGDQKGSFLALLAAARLQDPESVERFCQRCVTATGNEQVSLFDLLADMPASDQILDVLLKISAQPEMLSLKTPPGVAVADVDRRFAAVTLIARGYSLETIRARANALIDSAKPEERARVEQRIEQVLNQVEQFKNPPRPTTLPRRQPAERGSTVG